jgi:hypothetical protein
LYEKIFNNKNQTIWHWNVINVVNAAKDYTGQTDWPFRGAQKL